MMAQARMTMVTHDGSFHADDVMACAILKGLFPAAAVVRTRDPEAIASAGVVFDVGSAYDPSAMRYDHHMADGPRREDGGPYSSVGLVWKHHGMDWLALRFPDAPEGDLANAWADLDGGIVREIDMLDNGVGRIGHGGFPALVDDFNPQWDAAAGAGPEERDRAFMDAVRMARGVLARRADSVMSALGAFHAVRRAAEAADDPRVVVLEQPMPWERAIHEGGFEDALYVVYPAAGGGWMCSAVRPEPGSFDQRLPLPAEWAGLRGAELEAACGVEGAVFCHHARFVCGARTRDAVIEMARRAVARPAPAGPK